MLTPDKRSKKKKTKIILLSTLAVVIFTFHLVFIVPVKVELVLVTQLETSRLDRRPIWWAHITNDSKDEWHPFDEEIVEYLKNYDYSQGDLILSWGRSLKSLTYQRRGYLSPGQVFVGRPTFSSADTPTTIYIYETKSGKGKYFSNHLYYQQCTLYN